MDNNDVLKKLRIALSLKDEDIVEILALADFSITKSQVNAFFRNPDHPNFQVAGDQVLRRFLNGLITKNRGDLNADKPKQPARPAGPLQPMQPTEDGKIRHFKMKEEHPGKRKRISAKYDDQDNSDKK